MNGWKVDGPKRTRRIQAVRYTLGLLLIKGYKAKSILKFLGIPTRVVTNAKGTKLIDIKWNKYKTKELTGLHSRLLEFV